MDTIQIPMKLFKELVNSYDSTDIIRTAYGEFTIQASRHVTSKVDMHISSLLEVNANNFINKVELAESIKTLKKDLKPLLDTDEPFNIELL